MSDYRLTASGAIIRASDSACIPADDANRDYGAYQAWVAAGGVADPYVAPAPTSDDVLAERARRLSVGFDYNFGDVRGTHHIGTSDQDMIGWNEVTDLASALIAKGDSATTIAIVTDTGPVSVTAMEWQALLIAAGAFRQPIWAKSFALEIMNPIPSDYTSDSYWT